MSRESSKAIERAKHIGSMSTDEQRAYLASEKRQNKYHIKPVYRGHTWHVIAPNGLPIYDGALYGNDKPVIFKDEDSAQDCADRLNAQQDDEQPNSVLSVTKTD